LAAKARAADNAFDIGQQQATGRQRNYSLDIPQPEGWTCQVRQARGDFTVIGTRAREALAPFGNDRQHDTPSATGFPAAPLAQPIRPTATTPTARTTRLRLAELPSNVQVRSKNLCPAACNPNRLGNWVITMVQAGTGLEADRMLSLISFTSSLNRNSQAKRQASRPFEGVKACDIA